MERLIGILICSVFGQLALGITGGRTESSKSGKVPEILGLWDFGLSFISPSITISGYQFHEKKFDWNNIRLKISINMMIEW
jgi:hypothetical protein